MKARNVINNKKMNLQLCMGTAHPSQITPQALYSILYNTSKSKVHKGSNTNNTNDNDGVSVTKNGKSHEDDLVSAALAKSTADTAATCTVTKDKLLLIDVRDVDEYSQIYIENSLNIPYQQLNVRELFDKYAAGGFKMVFMSNCSPDVDDLAARDYIVEYERRTRHAPRKDSVCILLGGLFNWRTYCEL